MNRPRELHRALASVLSQTLAPAELIVVNDDQTTPEIRLPAGGEPKVTVVSSPGKGRSGVSAARNYGASIATGSYLAFLDDDDCWEPQFLEYTWERLENTGAAFALTGFWNLYDGVRKTAGKLPAAELLTIRQFILRNPGLTGSNFMIKRSAFEAVGGFDATLPTSNDKDFMIRLLAAGYTPAVVNERLVCKYEDHAARLTYVSRRKLVGSIRFFRKHAARMDRSLRRIKRVELYQQLYEHKLAQGKRSVALFCAGPLRTQKFWKRQGARLLGCLPQFVRKARRKTV